VRRVWTVRLAGRGRASLGGPAWRVPGRMRALGAAIVALAVAATAIVAPGRPTAAPAAAFTHSPLWAPASIVLDRIDMAVRALAGGTAAGPAAPPQAPAPTGPPAAHAPSDAHPPNARPPYPVPPPPDLYGRRPVVAIYHTDSTEAYLPAMRVAGQPGAEPFSTDQAVSVVQVGAILSAALYALGVPVAHSRAVNDPDGPIGAYENSARTARALLAAYPSVRVLLDLHRGGAGEGAPAPAVDHTAGVVLVVGTDDRLPDPHWRQTLAFAHVIAAAAGRLYPGWPVRVELSASQYNQEISAGALLVQVGGPNTSLGAADAAARRLARVLAAVLDSGLVPPPAR